MTIITRFVLPSTLLSMAGIICLAQAQTDIKPYIEQWKAHTTKEIGVQQQLLADIKEELDLAQNGFIFNGVTNGIRTVNGKKVYYFNSQQAKFAAIQGLRAKVADQEKAIAAIKAQGYIVPNIDMGQPSAGDSGYIGKKGAVVDVVLIIDKEIFIGMYGGSQMVMIRGVPTGALTEGLGYRANDPFAITGTRTYKDGLGSKPVLILERLRP